ncbi:TPA: hypothetical protein ACK1Z8_000959, partial [Klebsiella michiganensis]
RLACALNIPLFVHFAQTAQAPPVLARGGNFGIKKIVQNCACLCKNNRRKFDWFLELRYLYASGN